MVYEYHTSSAHVTTAGVSSSAVSILSALKMLIVVFVKCSSMFKPPPPVGAGGGYMFSGRPCVRPSVIHVVVLCFCDISSIC